MADNIYYTAFLVLPVCSHPVILGWDFLSDTDAFIACGRAELSLADECSPDSFSDPNYECRCTEDTVVPAGLPSVISLSCEGIPTSDIIVQSVGKMFPAKGIVIIYSIVSFDSETANALAFNTTNSNVFIPKDMVVAKGTPYVELNECSLAAIYPDQEPCDDNLLRHTIDSNLTEDQRERVFAIVKKHQHAFDFQKGPLGRADSVEHSIDTSDASLVRHRPYRVSSTERQTIEKEVTDMLEK